MKLQEECRPRSKSVSDRMSDLPGDIRSRIFSQLAPNDLLNVSILFPESDRLFNSITLEHISLDVPSLFTVEETEAQITKSEFISRAEQFIRHLRGANIESLVIKYNLDSRDQDAVDRWIQIAFHKGVQRLYLHFCSDCHQSYHFPLHHAYSGLKVLYLGDCVLNLNPSIMMEDHFCALRNLTNLVLEDVCVSNIILVCLFSQCLSLKDLALRRFSFSQALVSKALEIKSQTLSHLELSHGRQGLLVVDVETIDLCSFHFDGDIDVWDSRIHAPHLSEISFCQLHQSWGPKVTIVDAFSLFALLPCLQKLVLYLHASQEQLFQIWSFARLGHVKELELYDVLPLLDCQKEECPWLWVLDLVMACPSLQRLSLSFPERTRMRELLSKKEILAMQHRRTSHGSFNHNKLEFVEFHNFGFCKYEFAVGNMMLKYARSLQKMTIALVRSKLIPSALRESIRHKFEGHSNGLTQIILL